MFLPPIARGIIERRRRRLPTEGPIIPDVSPNAPRIGLAACQDRHGGVVTMQTFGGKHMRFDQRMHRLQCRGTSSDLVGQCREAEVDALAGIALTLPVQRLMLTELLEQDHGEEIWPGEAARRHMEGSRRLRDLLAFTARELLAHSLDHLPLARDHLQRLGDILAKLCQLGRTTARAV